MSVKVIVVPANPSYLAPTLVINADHVREYSDIHCVDVGRGDEEDYMYHLEVKFYGDAEPLRFFCREEEPQRLEWMTKLRDNIQNAVFGVIEKNVVMREPERE